MKIEELRIGNWVNTEHGFRKVATIEQNKIGTILKPCTMVLKHFDMNSVTPITLTADLLLKCGFKWNDELFELDCHEYRMYYKDYYILYNTIGTIKIKCDTLHQLQNLYFALTGKELTIETF